MPPTAPILCFDSPAGQLAPTVTCREFSESPLGRAAALRLEGLRTHFRLSDCVLLGETTEVDIVFETQRLASVELFLKLPIDTKGWGSWSEESERLRKSRGEAWIARLTGTAPEIVPLEIDGISVIPFEKNWDLTRGIRADWGIITSYFDAKAGFAGILIRFHPPAA